MIFTSPASGHNVMPDMCIDCHPLQCIMFADIHEHLYLICVVFFANILIRYFLINDIFFFRNRVPCFVLFS